MTLRFQKDDEAEWEARDKWKWPIWSIAAYSALSAVVHGVYFVVSGQTLAAFEKDLGETLAIALGFGCVVYYIGPIYWEVLIRTKEIDGKVSAIEAAVNASGKGHPARPLVFDPSKLMEKLVTIEAKLGGAETQPNVNTAHIEDGLDVDETTKWNYKVITINTEYKIVGAGELEDSRASDEIIESRLAEMGGDGWELVSFLPAAPTAQKWKVTHANPWMYHAVFKRPYYGDAVQPSWMAGRPPRPRWAVEKIQSGQLPLPD